MIRRASPTDIPYILSSTLKTLRHVGHNKYMTTTYFYKFYNPLINKMVSESVAYVYCNDESPEYIQGFLIVRGDAVLFAQTRKILRRTGIFKALFIEHFGEWKHEHTCLFVTKDYVKIFGKKFAYKPYGD